MDPARHLCFSVATLFSVIAVGTIGYAMIEGQQCKMPGRKKLESRISKLRDHFIRCGYGRIEREEYMFVYGDATSDEILQAAGIDHAKGLITAVTSDTDNIYSTLGERPAISRLEKIAVGGAL